MFPIGSESNPVSCAWVGFAHPSIKEMMLDAEVRGAGRSGRGRCSGLLRNVITHSLVCGPSCSRRRHARIMAQVVDPILLACLLFFFLPTNKTKQKDNGKHVTEEVFELVSVCRRWWQCWFGWMSCCSTCQFNGQKKYALVTTVAYLLIHAW
jgi:hypothetical protein